MFAEGKDIESQVLTAYALAFTNATAAGSGDNTEVDGATLDTAALAARANSVVFVVQAKATLTADKTLTVTANLQDSADGSNWTDITTPAVILTMTATGGSTARIGYDLTRARRYMRIQATPDLSHTSTDTATIGAVAVFGGLDRT